MLLAHQIQLNPNNAQTQYLKQCCGAARFAYNWALTEWKKQYEANLLLPKDKRTNITEGNLRKQLNAIKRSEYPFLLDVTKYAPQEAIKQLGEAFKRFFKGQSRYPNYRKKYIDDRFTIGNDVIQIKGNKVRLPKIGWIKMRETLRFPGIVKTISVRRMSDRWFISFGIEVDGVTHHYKKTDNQGVVGVDLGVGHLAVLSTGEKVDNPRSLNKSLKRLKTLQRRLSKKQRGSKNRNKARERVARLHRKITNIRKDALHKLTTSLTSRFGIICIETLNVSGMLKNKRLSRAIADASFYEVKRQLLYKAGLRGCEVVQAPQFFPSSKQCSHCQNKHHELKLQDRQWICTSCSAHHDRDINAALNLRNYAVSFTVKASGETSSGLVAAKPRQVKLASMKDEIKLIKIYSRRF